MQEDQGYSQHCKFKARRSYGRPCQREWGRGRGRGRISEGEENRKGEEEGEDGRRGGEEEKKGGGKRRKRRGGCGEKLKGATVFIAWLAG